MADALRTADFYAGVWTDDAARRILGRDAYVRAIRSWSLRPVAVHGGVMFFSKAAVRAHLPRPLSPAVAREYNALKRRLAALTGIRI
jgi:hypothetical protein